MTWGRANVASSGSAARDRLLRPRRPRRAGPSSHASVACCGADSGNERRLSARSSCARASASPAAPGRGHDVQREQRFGGPRPHHAGLVDQPRHQHGQDAIVALLERGQRAHRRGAHHRLGIGRRAEQRPQRPRIQRRARRRPAQPRAPPARSRSGSGPAADSSTRAPASAPMYSAALARSTAPCVRSTATAASAGTAAASPAPARYIVVATRVLFARRSPSPHQASICRRRPLRRLVVVAGGAGVGDAERGRGLGHRRLEGVIAAAHQQPPVHVAHVAVHAAAAGGIGGVERVGGELLGGPRDPAVGAVGGPAGDARPARRAGDASAPATGVAGGDWWHCVHSWSPARPSWTFTLSEKSLRRAVRDVAVGAGDRAGLEAARQRERLRPVEAVGPAVRPELALRVELGQRLAQQERQRVVLVAIAGRGRSVNRLRLLPWQ